MSNPKTLSEAMLALQSALSAFLRSISDHRASFALFAAVVVCAAMVVDVTYAVATSAGGTAADAILSCQIDIPLYCAIGFTWLAISAIYRMLGYR